MSAWVATTTVSILRGGTDDGYGDAVDNETVAASGLPASILEVGRGNTRRADGRPRTVRHYKCRVSGVADIRDDDRIEDERTGTIYVLDQLARSRNPLSDQDYVLDLSRST